MLTGNEEPSRKYQNSKLSKGKIFEPFFEFRETNVYGVKVPWAEGACGSAAIVLNNGVHELTDQGLVE